MKIDAWTISYATRVKVAALALLVLPTLFANLAYLRHNSRLDLRAVGVDEVTVYEGRFAELRKVLPGRGVVGYVDDQSDAASAMKALFLTQYALTPVIVVRGAEPELVIGNFSRPGAEAGEGLPKNLVPIKNFGNGVVLFGKGVQ